ncbi:hypothetical protein [Phyllobacterium sp. SB3]|uniref:hypothetical protein n=1 Tax=Phyllobacterium sp. SB3 TaxID=3156073 RepID=UPI0032AFB784
MYIALAPISVVATAGLAAVAHAVGMGTVCDPLGLSGVFLGLCRGEILRKGVQKPFSRIIQVFLDRLHGGAGFVTGRGEVTSQKLNRIG